MTGITKSFLFAMFGGGMGIYIGRRKAKFQENPTPNPIVHTDAT